MRIPAKQNNKTRAETTIHLESHTSPKKKGLTAIAIALVLSFGGWSPAQSQTNTPKPTKPEAPAPLVEPQKVTEFTSCDEVIHIGDSTSLGLKSKSILPNEEDRVAAQYKAVGVEKFHSEISGARSMVETYKDKPNATQVAKEYRAKNYKGCWVLALGTNDPANTKGDAEILSDRIDAMMKVVGDNPVIWTTTKSLRSKGAYQNKHMESWNKTLIESCKRYPNLRVYDWASEVQDDWFSGDGLHPNSDGYKERSARFARALARAFPKDGSSSKCVIRAD